MFWEYERIEHDCGRITYEIHDPALCEADLKDEASEKYAFICIEGADSRNIAAEICAMLNRKNFK